MKLLGFAVRCPGYIGFYRRGLVIFIVNRAKPSSWWSSVEVLKNYPLLPGRLVLSAAKPNRVRWFVRFRFNPKGALRCQF